MGGWGGDYFFTLLDSPGYKNVLFNLLIIYSVSKIWSRPRETLSNKCSGVKVKYNFPYMKCSGSQCCSELPMGMRLSQDQNQGRVKPSQDGHQTVYNLLSQLANM